MTTGDLFWYNKHIFFKFGQIQFATWVSAGVVQPSPSYWVQLTESSDLPTHLLSLQTLRHTRRRKRGERGKGGNDEKADKKKVTATHRSKSIFIWKHLAFGAAGPCIGGRERNWAKMLPIDIELLFHHLWEVVATREVFSLCSQDLF